MSNHLVCYATPEYQISQERLISSSLQNSIHQVHPWNRTSLVQTSFYRLHQEVLDLARGAGYWLWKPFIILESLDVIAQDDFLVYADAGIEILSDLSPVLGLCREKGGVLLFAGHYDDVGARGPNICRKWTKRDCFVLMHCDTQRFHEAQMLDASFLVLMNNRKSRALMQEWLLWCRQKQILTDGPNLCGLPDLDGFVEHRHDQSVLSLLAEREQIELFRHPSQFGNHLKMEPYREPGEWIRHAYGTKGIYHNSPYKTLLNHQRGSLDRRLTLQTTVCASRSSVFSALTEPESFGKLLNFFGYSAVRGEQDVQPSGKYCFLMRAPQTGENLYLAGAYLNVAPPEKLAFTWNWHKTWPAHCSSPVEMRVTVEFHEIGAGTEINILHERFPNDWSRKKHAEGWNIFIDRLSKLLPDSYPSHERPA